MYRRSALRIGIALTICAALLPLSSVASLVSEAAQGQSQDRKGRPRPGRPEGDLPDLDEIRHQPQIDHEAPPPIPSTMRSKRNEGKPWDGRRVGDPPLQGVLRAHARTRMMTPPPLPDNQFVQNFFTWALLRNPLINETTYWYDQLRVAYGQGQTSLKLAAIELGKTLFESADYAGRNRDAHGYVYDLYKAYLMREPDSGGWATWEGLVSSHGREYVRRGFEESGEFATLIATIVPNGSPSSNAASLITARVDPRNQPGNGMLTRDATWSLPLLSLPGRAGLDLGLVLSYSSQVWTRSDPYIYFDEDNGSPSPGFRLGFPTVQRKAFDAQTARNAYLFITGSGHRVELRQVGTSNIYDAADSSYLRLTENGATLLVYSTDGMKLSFSEINGEYRCVEIKDHNGNYITVSYNTLGQIANITDTLSRVITFNYDVYHNLLSITQPWGAQTHQWATFGWTSHTMHPSTGTLKVVGTADGSVLPLLMQVGLPDGSHYNFEYTNAAQVSVIRRYRADNTQPFYTIYQYEATTTDCPRLSQVRVAAENWTSVNGVPAEVTTYFAVDPDGACRMTAPDNTVYKEYYGTGWQKGLTTLSEVWVGVDKLKWTTTAWTQDNTGVSYETNPRVTETNVYDKSGNRRRTAIDYGNYAQWGLPYLVKDYAGDSTTEIRHTFYDYNLSQEYLDRRIIGLVSAIHQTDVFSWQRKISFSYDDPARLQALPAAATQHDTAYSSSFTARGNVTAVSRWDVTDIVNPAKALTSYTNYYTTGTPKSMTDAVGHPSSITYDDSFSDNVNRNTFAYPTTLTDADGFSSTVKYNFNFGGQTRMQGPPPAGQPQGAIQSITYDSLGRIERTTTENNGAYTRYVYGANYVQSFATVNNVADEAYAIQVFDGAGRVYASAANHPGSTGGYSAQMYIYDLMGRPIKTSNPAEITNAWVPAGDDAAGWLYSQQTYDWKGRPLRTTHPDTTYKEAAYSGCGCAGGEVVTLTDEGTIDAGVAKRRQQRIYSDVLGRTVKTEGLNWQGGTVYSTSVNTYNARDQVTQVRQYAGAEGSGTYQDTTMTYDGYGRLKTKHVPEQLAGVSITWDYNADDTIQKITDGRGAITALSYSTNKRKLVSSVTHTLANSTTISSSFTYDAAGNRMSMNDALGNVEYQYDQRSQLKAEIRTFTGLTNPNAADGKFKLNYDYNLAGALKKLTDSSSMSIVYGYDTAGRINSVTGADNLYAGVTQYASSFSYRAWGALKNFTDGTNHVVARSYNTRLQTSQFAINGTVTQNFDYFADGRIKFLHNLPDGNFDRSFSYDQMGRLVAARAGGAARQDGGAVPYNQSFSYDAFSNLNGRSTTTWNQFSSSDSASYVNNRRNGWEYDNDGRNTGIEDRNYYFDAAGQTSRLEAPMWVSALESYITKVMDSSYDGDGQKVKETTWDYSDYEPAVSRYYLRSTVLRGSIIAEIDGTGQKQVGYVYAGERVLAKQSNNQVSWKHTSPAGTGQYNSVVFGGYARVELDPFGADVTLSPTAPPENPPGPGEISEGHFGGIMDSRFADIFDTDGCVVDGAPESCGVAAAMVTFGTGLSRGMLSTTFNMASFAQSLPLKVASPDQLTLTFNVSGTEGRTTYETVWSDYLNQWVPMTPTAYSGIAPMITSSAFTLSSAVPQKPNRTPLSAEEIAQLENAVKTLLDRDSCARFVAGVLQKLGSELGLMDIIKALKNRGIDRSGAGGFGRRLISKRAAEAEGAVAYGNPQIDINYKIDPTVANVPVFIRNVGLTVLHEIFHVAGSGASHWKMLVAGYAVASEMHLKLGRKPSDTDPTQGTPDPNDPDGVEFDSYLWQTCNNMR